MTRERNGTAQDGTEGSGNGMEWNGKNEETKKWNELKWVKGTLKAG